MELINGMKAVNSGLTQKDESTIASTDLVQLYAQDGTPNGKISKADLMDAVKASLPALLSDQTTTADNVLTLASNALGKSTVANLASVLGGVKTDVITNTSYQNLESVPNGVYQYRKDYGVPSFLPSDLKEDGYGILEVRRSADDTIGVVWVRNASASLLYTNTYYLGSQDYRGWKKIATSGV